MPTPPGDPREFPLQEWPLEGARMVFVTDGNAARLDLPATLIDTAD